jgi:hypothetical protein
MRWWWLVVWVVLLPLMVMMIVMLVLVLVLVLRNVKRHGPAPMLCHHQKLPRGRRPRRARRRPP